MQYSRLILFILGLCIVLIKAQAQAPATAAPSPPTRSDTKVISIFSDSYNDVGGTNYSPYWNQSTIVSTVNIAGNPTLKFSQFNYQGLELGSVINTLPMTHLHLDVWTSGETQLSIAPISQTASNKDISLTPIKLNSWNSYDISLSTAKANWPSIGDIFQFILKGPCGKTVYTDNLIL